MNENAEPLVLAGQLLARNAHVTLGAELGYCVGDGVVETTIERSKLVDREGGVTLNGKACDGLTEIAVVMDDLVDCVPEFMERMAVRCCRDAYLGQRSAVASRETGNSRTFWHVARFFGPQRSRQLLQENRDPVGKL